MDLGVAPEPPLGLRRPRFDSCAQTRALLASPFAKIGKPVGRPTQHKGGREVGDERGAKSRHGASPLP